MRAKERAGEIGVNRTLPVTGGNLVNASPIGDTIPALIVLGASVDIAGVNGSRMVPIGEFYAGYRKTVLQPDELLTQVGIPIPARDEIFKLYKVSRRKDLDIASFGAAIWMKLGGAGAIADVRIAYGGVGPTVLRLPKTESFLTGKTFTEPTLKQAGTLAASEVAPISDVRASQRLTSSASCLVAGSHGPDRELERLLARQNRGLGSKPILEVNLRHPLVAAIAKAGADASDLSFLLLEQAQILDGDLPEDPAAFASRLNRLVVRSLHSHPG